MVKPSDYPPVADMSIKALRELADRLEHELTNKHFAEWDEIIEESDRLIAQADIPMTVAERAEMYPTNAVYDIDGGHHLPAITDNDIGWFILGVFTPMLLFMGFIALLVFYDV